MGTGQEHGVKWQDFRKRHRDQGWRADPDATDPPPLPSHYQEGTWLARDSNFCAFRVVEVPLQARGVARPRVRTARRHRTFHRLQGRFNRQWPCWGRHNLYTAESVAQWGCVRAGHVLPPLVRSMVVGCNVYKHIEL